MSIVKLVDKNDGIFAILTMDDGDNKIQLEQLRKDIIDIGIENNVLNVGYYEVFDILEDKYSDVNLRYYIFDEDNVVKGSINFDDIWEIYKQNKEEEIKKRKSELIKKVDIVKNIGIVRYLTSEYKLSRDIVEEILNIY